ncbi:MAG: hypothetical protein R2761_05130 [Acidimicrobiales bacterium]
MPPRYRSLHGSAETFAHVAGASPDPERPLEGLDVAHSLGASGFDGPVRLTADGAAVVHPADSIGSRLRRKPLSALDRAQLPATVVSLDDLCRRQEAAGSLLLDIADDRALAAVLAVARAASPTLEERLWLCSSRVEDLMRWRQTTTARLVHTVKLTALPAGPEQWVAHLTARSIDGLCAFHGDWTGGLVALAHRFERLTVARGLEHEREVAAVFDIGIDGVSSPQVERLMAVAALYYPAQYG